MSSEINFKTDNKFFSNSTICHLLYQNEARFGARLAVSTDENRQTYSEFLALVGAIAWQIKNEIRKEQQLVLVSAEKCFSYPALVWGILLSGHIYCPCSANNSVERLNEALKQKNSAL